MRWKEIEKRTRKLEFKLHDIGLPKHIYMECLSLLAFGVQMTRERDEVMGKGQWSDDLHCFNCGEAIRRYDCFYHINGHYICDRKMCKQIVFDTSKVMVKESDFDVV